MFGPTRWQMYRSALRNQGVGASHSGCGDYSYLHAQPQKVSAACWQRLTVWLTENNRSQVVLTYFILLNPLWSSANLKLGVTYCGMRKIKSHQGGVRPWVWTGQKGPRVRMLMRVGVGALQAEAGGEGRTGCLCWSNRYMPSTVLGARGCLIPVHKTLEQRRFPREIPR